MNLYLLPVFWAIIHLFLAFLSFVKIKNSNDTVKFIYKWGFLFGAFVWEDLFIFSLLNVGVSILVLIFGNLLPGLLLIVIFWIVRNGGETVYFMLQQFIEPKHHPHEIDMHFEILRKFFGKISTQKCFIIMQVIHQTFFVVFTFILIMLVKYWPDLTF